MTERLNQLTKGITMKRIAVAIALVASLFTLGVVQSAPASATNPYTHWIVNQSSLDAMSGLTGGMTSTEEASWFNSVKTFIVKRSGTNTVMPNAQDTEVFDAFTGTGGFFLASQNHTIKPTTTQILLDLEAWPATPLADQQDPFGTAGSARGYAHVYKNAAGVAQPLKLIFTPAVNLTSVIKYGCGIGGCSHTGDKYAQYLADDFPAQSVKNSDTYEVQAQQTEGTSQATTFAPAAIAAAKAQNPNITRLIGVSTYLLNNGYMATAADMSQVAQSTPDANGYWLNIPANTTCPCSPQNPQAALDFLRSNNW